jgi:glycosyltransferase involved in cell wall biosynthesis
MRLFVYMQDFPADGESPNLGICKAVHGLAQGFAENGTPVVVLCEGDHDSLRELTPGYEVRCIAGAPPARLYGSVSSGLRKFLVENSTDALYVLNGIFHPGVCAVASLLRQIGVPYIVAPHDPYHPTIFTKNSLLKWPYWYLRERPMLNGAMAIQVLDARHGQWLARLGVTAPVIETTNGYAQSDVLPESELSWHHDARPSAMFMGRIDSHNKGLDLLLTALSEIAPEARPSLTIQGPDWGDRPALIAQASRLGIEADVSFPDADFTTPSPSLIGKHDIFCLVSRFEGFGLAALEAMLAGRVVIVSEIAGIAPHVRASGCGIVVTANIRSIREGLAEMMKLRPQWPQMGMAGRQYAIEHLRWGRIAAGAWNEYKRLMASREPAGSYANARQLAV